MITVTTDGSSAKIGTTDSKGTYDIQLTAPNANGDHNIQAHFAGNSQYKSADSSTSKVTVQGGTNAAISATTSSTIDTSLSLKVEGNDKMAAVSSYSVSGKLIDSLTKEPISGKEISVTTDGGSPKGSDSTNSKGEFDVNLKAPDNTGKYGIKAQFDGDSQYKSSDSSVKITVEETSLKTEKTTTTTDQKQTNDKSSSDSSKSSSDSSSSDSSKSSSDSSTSDKSSSSDSSTSDKSSSSDSSTSDKSSSSEEPTS